MLYVSMPTQQLQYSAMRHNPAYGIMDMLMGKDSNIGRSIPKAFKWRHLDVIQTLCTCLTDVRVGG